MVWSRWSNGDVRGWRLEASAETEGRWASNQTATRRELLVWSAWAGALAVGALVLGVLTKPAEIADAELASLLQETVPAGRAGSSMTWPGHSCPSVGPGRRAALPSWARAPAVAPLPGGGRRRSGYPALHLASGRGGASATVRCPRVRLEHVSLERTRPWDSWCSPRWPPLAVATRPARRVWRVWRWPSASSSRSGTSRGMPTARST